MVVRNDHPATKTRGSRPLPVGILTLAVVLVVLAVVVVLVGFELTGTTYLGLTKSVQQAPAALVQEVSTIPASDFDAVGDPSVPLLSAPAVVEDGPRLALDGKPAVVWVGALYCPYCAAERWALVIALGRFGTFTKLYTTSSSTTEVFGGTETFSFDGSVYRSSTIALAAVEEYGNSSSAVAPPGYEKLQKPTGFESAVVGSYDKSPWADPGRLPFLDVANRIVVSGSSFSPAVIGGLSMQQIATDLTDPGGQVAQALLGAADQITSAICAATGDTPASVCSSPAVLETSERLGLSN
jgi:thiol-disulfide isomerase/thioredoxin